MGELADSVLSNGGKAIGVIPESLVQKEVGHTGLTKLHVVDSMHERKAQMAALADAFIALPGGIGTMDEFFEMVSWTQLGLHEKPCGLLNVCRYYDRLIDFVDHAVDQGFIKQAHRSIMVVDEDPGRLLRRLQNHGE
jgi:uncharacterized protein (TIGR00730 family)